MKITFNYLDVRRYHNEILSIIGDKHDYSSRSVMAKYAEYFTTSDLTVEQEDFLIDLSVESNSEVVFN